MSSPVAKSQLIESLRSDPTFMAQVQTWHTFPAREGVYSPFPKGLDPRLVAGLRQRGMTQLYSHQARAFEASVAGRHVLVATPTASGKSLCYNLPVMQTLLENPEARALYLFPTKALSQDQQSELNETTLGADLGLKVSTYDGDTPTSLRASARETGQIIISNPDMFHSGILPNHPKWIKFLKNLRYVVVDEVHTYRGVFGSHVANVLRRLQRVAAFYGAHPQFIVCSATIGNPLEHAQKLLGLEVELIDQSGAPTGARHFVLYNPPLVDRVQGIRRGTVNEAQALAVRVLTSGQKAIVFARSRVRVELIASYIHDKLDNLYTDNQRIRVESYRGGYLPNERREIEKGLRDGTIQGVVSTNALELGIDIGGLDVAILAGFPGSVSSVWQQAGRAGRRQTESLAILIASSAPLDQYMVTNDRYFLERPPEAAFINPENPYVLMEHVKCAAFELPFQGSANATVDRWFPEVTPYLAVMEEEGTLRHTGGRWYWSGLAYPAENVSLRSATAENIVIIDTTGGKNQVLGEMDRPSAKEMIFPNAVYLHRDRQFLVLELDLQERRCYVEEREINYYTDAVVKTDLKVLHEDRRFPGPGCTLVLGDVLVRSQVSRFKKLKFHTHENIGYGEVALPEEQMHTRSLTLLLEGGPAADALEALTEELKGPAMARMGHLLKAVAPAFLLCQSQDFGVSERLRDPHFDKPAIFVYDQSPGGSGLAESLADQLGKVLAAGASLVRACPCSEGCPSCIGPRDPEHEVGLNPKEGVLALLDGWLGSGTPGT
ncbi:MAG: DEAD/DEAH box helicase [Spirochaetales bacterium]